MTGTAAAALADTSTWTDVMKCWYLHQYGPGDRHGHGTDVKLQALARGLSGPDQTGRRTVAATVTPAIPWLNNAASRADRFKHGPVVPCRGGVVVSRG